MKQDDLNLVIVGYIENEKEMERLENIRKVFRDNFATMCPNGYENDRINIFWKTSETYKHPKNVEQQIAALKLSIKKIEDLSIQKGLSKLKGQKRTLNISVR